MMLPCVGLRATSQPSSDLFSTPWDDREGAPMRISVLAQTSDGYLWIGCPTGLYRFDALHFALS